MWVSWNGGYPLIMGFSLINHLFWGYPHLWKPPDGCLNMRESQWKPLDPSRSTARSMFSPLTIATWLIPHVQRQPQYQSISHNSLDAHDAHPTITQLSHFISYIYISPFFRYWSKPQVPSPFSAEKLVAFFSRIFRVKILVGDPKITNDFDVFC